MSAHSQCFRHFRGNRLLLFRTFCGICARVPKIRCFVCPSVGHASIPVELDRIESSQSEVTNSILRDLVFFSDLEALYTVKDHLTLRVSSSAPTCETTTVGQIMFFQDFSILHFMIIEKDVNLHVGAFYNVFPSFKRFRYTRCTISQNLCGIRLEKI